MYTILASLLLALQLVCLAGSSAAGNATATMTAAALFGAADPRALASALFAHALGPALADLASLDKANCPPAVKLFSHAAVYFR